MRKAIIIGAGPAGLTAAYELLKRTDIQPIILEKTGDIGGISKTIDCNGNRMDIQPHRFFSKSKRVKDWWLHVMPLAEEQYTGVKFNYHNKIRIIEDPCSYKRPVNKDNKDKRMLVIPKLTKVYFLGKFFTYPLQLSPETLKKLGIVRTIQIIFSFIKVKLFTRRPEKSLEDIIINKFGKQLYLLFFKDFMEKVWGVPCREISPEWGERQIKGISLSKAMRHALKGIRNFKKRRDMQKGPETSPIEQFFYPKYGAGSLWEEVASIIEGMGGKILKYHTVQEIYSIRNEVCSVHVINTLTGEMFLFEGDYFFSSMAVQELIACMNGSVPLEVKEVAAGLQYRDFINVGALLQQLPTPGKQSRESGLLTLQDNCIHIQVRDVKASRLQIYNNWGVGMVNDPNTIWIGMEYFCNKTDNFWNQADTSIQQLAIQELERMGLARVEDVLDITVQRMEKAYPSYSGSYDQFGIIRKYVEQFDNLFLVGCKGTHKYNNADYSVLTAMIAVDNIVQASTNKANLWASDTEIRKIIDKVGIDGRDEFPNVF